MKKTYLFLSVLLGIIYVLAGAYLLFAFFIEDMTVDPGTFHVVQHILEGVSGISTLILGVLFILNRRSSWWTISLGCISILTLLTVVYTLKGASQPLAITYYLVIAVGIILKYYFTKSLESSN